MSEGLQSADLPPLTSLTKSQRRVLGTLVEKAITVPESYPLTLKALTTGCNQKNNRDPVTHFGEDDVQDAVTELRALGLAAVVHTESGRTERFRHYLRQRIADLSEPQVAILAELLLRGRQPTGDLRARASRMAPAGSLDTLDQLRHELAGLQSRNQIQADGPLERRGVEIDHTLYEPSEVRTIAPGAAVAEPPLTSPAGDAIQPSFATAGPAPRPTATHQPDLGDRLTTLESTCAALRIQNEDLRSELGAVRDEISRLTEELRKLRDALGA